MFFIANIAELIRNISLPLFKLIKHLFINSVEQSNMNFPETCWRTHPQRGRMKVQVGTPAAVRGWGTVYKWRDSNRLGSAFHPIYQSIYLPFIL